MSIITGIEDKHIQGFELEDKIHDGENVVGCFYKNSGIINVININKQYDEYIGQEVDIDGFGRWYIDDIVPKQEKVSSQLKLYDLSYRFDKEYNISTAIFPCTVIVWASTICSTVGLELGSTTFPNSEFVLEEQPYLPEGATYRDALKMIAESAGCFVKIGTDNKVYIKWFEDTKIDIEDWFELSQSPQTNPINVVILGRGDVEDNIRYPIEIPENPVELRIDDNQILYFNREEMIIPIYNQVNGFKFYPFKMRTAGRPLLKAGMKVKYTDIDGLEIETYVMYHKITYTGGIGENTCYISNIESYELKETSTKYEYTGSIEQRVINTERICDKNSNQIIDIIQQQEGNKSQLNTIIQEIDQTTARIEKVEGETSQINELKETIDGISNTLTQKGGNNLFYYDTEFWKTENEEDTLNIEEYSDTEIIANSTSGKGYLVGSGTSVQSVNVQNGTYTVSFKYKKIGPELATASVKINNEEYALDATDWTDFAQTIDVTTNSITIEITADTNNTLYVVDLLANIGPEKEIWTQNPNETITDTVKIGKGIEVRSTEKNTYHRIDADGNRTYNIATGKVVNEATDKGSEMEELLVRGQAQISGLLVKQVEDQIWLSSLL